jgi:4-coumarate--CoA ligase
MLISTDGRATCSVLAWHPREISHSFSVGEPSANCEIKLVDSSEAVAEITDRNTSGEIWVRAPNVMKGYWHNPQATAEVLTPDGWLKTGDIGYVDQEGKVYIIDRKKELIKVRGNQVAPAELEAVLLNHPNIIDAAVVGVTM